MKNELITARSGALAETAGSGVKQLLKGVQLTKDLVDDEQASTAVRELS